MIPYRPRASWEARLLSRTLFVYDDLPRVETVLCDDTHRHEGLFSHAEAYNRGAQKAAGDVLVLGDADSFPSSTEALSIALKHVHDRAVPWALPASYVQLARETTERLLADEISVEQARAEPPFWRGTTSWAGVIVVRRDVFFEVGGADERYVGHGADDVALAMKLNTLIGEVVRYPFEAVHLWHPRGVQEEDRHEHSGAQWALTHRYTAAAGDPEAMREVARL